MDDFVFHYAKRKDNGAYYAEVYQPPTPGQNKGQRRRFTLRTKNKRVAESRFRQLEDAYARGEFDP